MFLTTLNIAFRNMLQGKRRTFLLGLAVALVAMLFLLLRTVSYSLSERMIETATTLSAGHVNVSGFYKARKRDAGPIVSGREKLMAAVRASVPEAVKVIDRHRGWGRVIGPASSINAGVSGIIVADEDRFFNVLRLAPESDYRAGGGEARPGNFKDLEQANTVLLFAAQAKKLGVGVGDSVTIVTEGSGGQANTVDLRVAAVAMDLGMMSNWNIYVPRQTVLDLYRLNSDTTGVVQVYLPDSSQATAVMERLRKQLKQDGLDLMDHDPQPFWMKFDKVSGEDWLGQKIDLTIWSDEISFVLWITNALDLVSFFVVGVLAIIIIGGIMNAMWMAVRERTKEIGTMRAIGSQRGFIVRLFVFEAVLLGVLSAAVGTSLGALLISVINGLDLPIKNDGARLFLMANTVAFNLHPAQMVTTLCLFSVITGAAALYPAFKASRLKPVEALMHTK